VIGSGGYVSGNQIYCFNGTSGATPIVSGVAGPMLAANLNLTAGQVQQLFKANTDDIVSTSFDNGTDYGCINANRPVITSRGITLPVNDTAGAAFIGALPAVGGPVRRNRPR
jgi:subtilisin family serine protease